MWRLLLVVVALGMLGSACSDGLSDGTDIEEEFHERRMALQNGTFTVTYVMETITETETEVRNLVWYQDGTVRAVPLFAGKSRIDQSGEFGLLIEINAETSYRCGEGEDGKRACVPPPYGGSGEPEYWFVAPASHREGVVVTGSRSETIAGAQAECYELEVDFSVPYSTMEMCLAEEGLLLSGQTGAFEVPGAKFNGQVISMTAVDVKTDVADDAFEPPYPVVDQTRS